MLSSYRAFFIIDDLAELFRFITRFCQGDFDMLDITSAFCHKRTGLLSFSSAAGPLPMEADKEIRSGRGRRII
jgi:hypothetical protein